MSEAESPALTAGGGVVTVDDVRALVAGSTPHFALQLRNRLRRLALGLPAGHPARAEAEREIARLEALGFAGEHRGRPGEPGLAPLASAGGPIAG